jgi:hypothetical protein
MKLISFEFVNFIYVVFIFGFHFVICANMFGLFSYQSENTLLTSTNLPSLGMGPGPKGWGPGRGGGLVLGS